MNASWEKNDKRNSVFTMEKNLVKRKIVILTMLSNCAKDMQMTEL